MGNKPIIWSYWNHEPIYHLKRMGNDGGTVFSLGEWVDEWYDRIHGEELIKKGAEAGINTVYIHYYKGSGILFEKEEMNRTKEFAKIAHKYGITVLGYMSMGSIYTENISREIPNVRDMLIVNQFGKETPTLCNQYYRPRPCFNNEPYLKHLKSIIKYGIEEIGLDGFHFDNATMHFCYCESCRKKFREYLTKNHPNPYKIMGIKDFDFVEIPRLEYPVSPYDLNEIAPQGNIHDVLLFWYLQFLRESVSNFHRACFDYVKEVSKGQARVLYNPGFPRVGREARTHGFDPIGTPESCDFAFVENMNGYFGKHYGSTAGQTLAFKYGERFGYQVFDTSWANANGKPYQFPKNKSAILGFVMQSAIYGSIAGVPWTVRSMRKGDSVAIDTPYLYEGICEAFGYFKKNFDIFDASSYNRVKVLHHPDNYLCADGAIEESCNVPTHLTEHGIPYSIITEDEIKNMKAGETLVLPKILYCTAALYEDVKKVAKKGVKVLATEGFGQYNEYTKVRCEDDEIFDLQGIGGNIVKKEELADLIDKDLSIDVSDVLLETRITKDGKLVLHALNADAERELGTVTLTFKDPLLQNAKVTNILSPDGGKATVTIENGCAAVKINNLKTLVSIIFEVGA